MIKVTVNDFINTLITAISSSPTSFITLVAGIIFLIAMLISIKKHKKIGKSLFIIGWLFVILFIIFRYSNHLTTLFDNLINNIFMQIFFPNLATYIIIIAITNFIFLFTILKNNSKTSNKIINSLFFVIIMLLLILVLDVIFKNNINVYEKLTVYTNQTLLILIEATTITFILWLIILGSKAIVSKLIEKSDKKVQKKYSNQKNSVNKDAVQNIIPEKIKPDNNENLNIKNGEASCQVEQLNHEEELNPKEEVEQLNLEKQKPLNADKELSPKEEIEYLDLEELAKKDSTELNSNKTETNDSEETEILRL